MPAQLVSGVSLRRLSGTRLEEPVHDYLAWKSVAGAADTTISQYGNDLSRLAAIYPDVEIEAFTSEMCLHAIASYPRGSHKRVRAILNDFFGEWAIAWGRVPDNPMRRVPVIRRPAVKQIDIFDDQEEDGLCSLPELRDRALMQLLFQTGIRKGEAIRMQLKDFKPQRMLLDIPRAKGGKTRRIPVGHSLNQTIGELEEAENLRPSDYLWYGVRTNQSSRKIIRDHPVPDGTFFRWWVRSQVAAEIVAEPDERPGSSAWFKAVVRSENYRKPHTTRHTFATKYIQADGRAESLRRILGHSSATVTDTTYTHLRTDDLAHDLAGVLTRRGRNTDQPGSR